MFGRGSAASGVQGQTDCQFCAGVAGFSPTSNITSYGVYGKGTDSAIGVFGDNNSTVIGYSGLFNGRVQVVGYLQKSGGGFHIDHPLDPENRFLNHSFVESPDMKNFYDGIVQVDGNGEAWVELPEWFGALNRDFRYQLTSLGVPSSLYVAEELTNSKFKIGGGKPKQRVSWAITGIRHDAWAEKNRPIVDEPKPTDERGTYLTPEAFGQPLSNGVIAKKYAVKAPAPRDESSREKLK